MIVLWVARAAARPSQDSLQGNGPSIGRVWVAMDPGPGAELEVPEGATVRLECSGEDEPVVWRHGEVAPGSLRVREGRRGTSELEVAPLEEQVVVCSSAGRASSPVIIRPRPSQQERAGRPGCRPMAIDGAH